jgi:phosphonate transport system substrate-binding protein
MRTDGPTRTSVLGLLLAALLLCVPCGRAQEPDELVIGLIPEMNVFEQVKRYQALADHLSAELGLNVRLTMLSRYGNIMERIVNQEVDAAFLGSFTGALASAQLGWIPLARPINLDNTSTYWGYLFVRKDSGIREVAQMRGKRLALVEMATTAGYVFPVAYFREHGVADVRDFFSDVQFWGSHDSAIQAVLEGHADVGAAKNTIWEHLSRESPRIEAELEILATSAKVPSNGLLVSPSIDAETREKIRQTLLGLQEDPTAGPVLAQLGAKGFVPTDAESYLPVLDLAAQAGIDLTTYTYENR